jgi:hypothetical protein
MTITAMVEQYAPGLRHLAMKLEPFDSVICSWSAGPQPAGGGAWGDAPHITIQPETLYHEGPIFICIRGENDCTVVTDFGEEYEITFQAILNYLRNLPKPLYYFTDL